MRKTEYIQLCDKYNVSYRDAASFITTPWLTASEKAKIPDYATNSDNYLYLECFYAGFFISVFAYSMVDQDKSFCLFLTRDGKKNLKYRVVYDDDTESYMSTAVKTADQQNIQQKVREITGVDIS